MAEDRSKTQWRAGQGPQGDFRRRNPNAPKTPRGKVVKPNLAKTSFKVLDLMEVSPQNFDEMCAHLSNDAIGLESRVSIDEAKRQIF
jgi:hypothetical protein